MTADKEAHPYFWIVAILLALALLIVGVLVSGCATSKGDAARQGLTTAARINTEAIKAFAKYDREHQMAIVEKAKANKNQEAGREALDEYRKQRSAIKTAILDARSAQAQALATIELAEAGAASQLDIQNAVTFMVGTMLRLKELLATHGIGDIK